MGGRGSPDGMQRLLRRADWDVDGVRDDVRAYVVEHLGDPDGVLIADDTGFLKKGTRSAGVQRQYSGTAGRTENCQVGVLLAYASRYGHALIDRELYLPQSWAEDPDRCWAAGIPQDVEFTTKPRQAQAMIARAVAAGVPFAWFTADETYGQAKWLQTWYWSAPGGPGMPTSPCPCSPWPGWPPAGPRPKRGGRYQRSRHDRLHVTGAPPPADQPGPGPRTRP